jgi:rhomboid protease GluP
MMPEFLQRRILRPQAMADGQINYEAYSDLELRQALLTIDQQAFPLNYERLKATLDARARGELSPAAGESADPGSSGSDPAVPREILEFEELLLRLTPRTPVTYALIAINVAVFAAMAWAGAGLLEPNPLVHIAWGSNLVPVTVDGEWWRLGTSMFLHFGMIHMLVNMWVLYANGRLVERMFGSARFLILYLAAGLCGSMASAGWNPAVNSAGASGAIFGVLGGLGAFLVAKRCRVPSEVVRAQSKSVAVFVLFNVINGLAHQGIDNAAHFGGLVGGFLVGLALARPLTPESREVSHSGYVSGVVAAVAVCLVASAALVGNARDRFSPEARFSAAAVWFEYREPKVLAAYNEMINASHAGKSTDTDVFRHLNADVIPFYAEAVERLYWNRDVADPQDDTRRKLTRYVSLRKESMSMFADALQINSRDGAEKAMQLQREGDRLVDEINAAAKAESESAKP